METGMQAVRDLVIVPLQSALNQLLTFAPTVLGALLILLLGGLIAKLIEQVIVRALKVVTLDKIAEQVQLSAMLAKGGIRRKPSELVGAVIYWIVMLAFVMTAMNALGLDKAAEWFAGIINYLPQVVGAVFILIIGSFAGAFLAATVRTASSNAGILQSHLLGQVVHMVVITLSIVAALKQVGFEFVDQVFLIILAGISLGSALAFGLGCKDLAGRWMSDFVEQLQPRKR